MQETTILQVALYQPREAASGDDPLAHHRENVLAVLEEAKQFDPDFIVFPELVLPTGARNNVALEELAHPIPNETTDLIGQKAQAAESYVCFTTYEREGDDIFNSAALIGPDGNHKGTYRKIAPTIDEIEEQEITPGKELPVWDTEFGRVAATICWDVRFDEIALGYRDQEIDLLLHPTHGLGQGKLKHWAIYHGFHIAYCREYDTKVFTPHGNVIGQTKSHPAIPEAEVDLHGGNAQYALATINTDMRSYSWGGLNYEDSELQKAQRAYPDSLEINCRYEDGVIIVESVDEDISVEQVEEEFNLSTTTSQENSCRDLINSHVTDSPLLQQ